jgi:hypothetical protein
MTVSLPQKKKEIIANECERLLSKQTAKIREVARVTLMNHQFNSSLMLDVIFIGASRLPHDSIRAKFSLSQFDDSTIQLKN